MTHGEAIVRALEKLGRPAPLGELRRTVASLGHVVGENAFSTALANAKKSGKVSASGLPKSMVYDLSARSGAPKPVAPPKAVPPIRRTRPPSIAAEPARAT